MFHLFDFVISIHQIYSIGKAISNTQADNQCKQQTFGWEEVRFSILQDSTYRKKKTSKYIKFFLVWMSNIKQSSVLAFID